MPYILKYFANILVKKCNLFAIYSLYSEKWNLEM